MTERPILRFPAPTNASRKKKDSRFGGRKPTGPGPVRQGERFAATFDRLRQAQETADPGVALRQDPTGIAPERALVFETAAPIQNFAKVAHEAGMEVLGEYELETLADLEDIFEAAEGQARMEPVLYATMPTQTSFERMLRYWRAYQRGGTAPHGLTPWWNMFDLLYDLRPWGPDDRFTKNARAEVLERLPFDDEEEALLELEIWQSPDVDQRTRWRDDTEAKVIDLGGRVLDRSSISGVGFTYEALLASLSAGTIREMINGPMTTGSLASLDGLQFILPQTIAQSAPVADEDSSEAESPSGVVAFDEDLPKRAILFDSVPTAGHSMLDGGVVIEDVHDLVPLSQVDQRYHATAMASLILRGDLEADGNPLWDSRLLSIPLLVDHKDGTTSPKDRLFVDLLHTALVRAITGDEPLAPDAFVVNLSIGVGNMRFANRISALARLIDWWSWKEGVLFVVSSGNVGPVKLSGVSAFDFEDANDEERLKHVRHALFEQAYDRTLLAPAEALNAITVGAVSEDHTPGNSPDIAGVMRVERDGEILPQITAALGLGPLKAIKPDLLTSGGVQELRVLPDSGDAILKPLSSGRRAGLIAAAPSGGTRRSHGTSDATALTTRALLQAAAVLVEDDGPYQGLELPRRDVSLLTRALAVNSALWPDAAMQMYEEARERLGTDHHAAAKLEVARHFGHGVLQPLRMTDSPSEGVTLIGLGDIRKDGAQIFNAHLPPSLSGEKLPRSMRVTLAWFSPIDPVRPTYRLAKLGAIAAAEGETTTDKGWGLNLKGAGPDANMVGRGSVWSWRLVTNQKTTPEYGEEASVPIRVQCQETMQNALSPDDDIRFAIVVSMEVEAEVEFDIHAEVKEAIRVKLQGIGR